MTAWRRSLEWLRERWTSARSWVRSLRQTPSKAELVGQITKLQVQVLWLEKDLKQLKEQTAERATLQDGLNKGLRAQLADLRTPVDTLQTKATMTEDILEHQQKLILEHQGRIKVLEEETILAPQPVVQELRQGLGLQPARTSPAPSTS